MSASSDNGEGEHSWLNEEFQDNLMHVRLIRKDGTTVPVKILLQSAYQAGYAAAKADCLAAAPEKKTYTKEEADDKTEDFGANLNYYQKSAFNAAIDLYQQHIREMK